MPFVLLAQVDGAVGVGIATLGFALLGGLIHVVWKLSALASSVAHIEQWCKQHDDQDSDLNEKLDDHEVRIVRLESGGHHRRYPNMGS